MRGETRRGGVTRGGTIAPSFTLSVENKLIMLSVVMLSVVRLNVVAPTFCVDFREKCIIGVTFSSTQKLDSIKLFLP